MRAAMIAVCLCAGVVSRAGAQDLSDLESQVASLGRQLRFENAQEATVYERTVAAGGVEKMRALLTAYTSAVLDSMPDAGADALAARLKKAYSPWAPTPHEAEAYTATTPEVFRDRLNSVPVVTVSWLIWIGGRGSPKSAFTLQAYTPAKGKYTLAAETGALLRDHSEFVRAVASKQPGELWFVAYGTRFGSTRVDMAAALFAFNGTGFKTRWSQPNLPGGKITFLLDGIGLEYRDYYAAGPNWRNIEEELRFSPTGLETKNRREVRRSP